MLTILVNELTSVKEIALTIESISKTIGIIVGAIWVYLRFIRTRESHPKIEFNIDLKSLGRQDKKILIEIIANLENKGQVRHWVNNFTCDVLILRSVDSVVPGDKRINYQTLFEKYNPIKSYDGDRTGRIVWIPEKWYESFIDGGIKQQYTYLTEVPENTAFISIYSQFYYEGDDFQTAQKTFSVEQLEKNASAKH